MSPMISAYSHQDKIARFLAGAPHAVVGASRDRSKYGNRVLRVYLQNGRPVYPVNPGGATDRGFDVLYRPGIVADAGSRRVRDYAAAPGGGDRGASQRRRCAEYLVSARCRIRRGCRASGGAWDECDRRRAVHPRRAGLQGELIRQVATCDEAPSRSSRTRPGQDRIFPLRSRRAMPRKKSRRICVRLGQGMTIYRCTEARPGGGQNPRPRAFLPTHRPRKTNRGPGHRAGRRRRSPPPAAVAVRAD